MPITYEFEIDGDTLKVKAAGVDDSLDEVKQYGMAVIEATIQNGCVRVLCDERNLQYKLGTIDTFELAQHIVNSVPRVAKIALVCSADDIKDASFFETVVVNRGLMVKAFKELDAATAWLQNQSK
ncbi:MAG: hypothetical protein HGB19_02575 [Chlorobiales bacterium]|nr:hypothetical protein [Chlorobiales bacterium]